jgi:hypothetical protein
MKDASNQAGFDALLHTKDESGWRTVTRFK